MTHLPAMEPLRQTFELVRKAKAGDADALSQLFERYYGRVLMAVRSRLGPKLRRHLESVDVLQQTFAKAFEKFDAFEMRDEGSLRHWLAKIAEGKIRDEADRYSAAIRKPPGKLVELDAPLSARDSVEMADLLPADVSAPGARASMQEQQKALLECLDSLPQNYREIIVLRNLEGLEWKDVAKRSGRPSVSAAREMHRTAMEELKKCLLRRGMRQSIG